MVEPGKIARISRATPAVHRDLAVPRLAESSDLMRWTELGGEPLEAEMENVVKDGHRLFAMAVQSCVPDTTAAAILSRTWIWTAPTR